VDSETVVCGEDLEFELDNRLMSEEVKRSELDRPALRHVVPSDISGCLWRKFKASAALPAKVNDFFDAFAE
jgi:hypothetical protein